MKVIAINGSPRKEGNTAAALKVMTEELKKQGVETEIIELRAESIHGCIGCAYCETSENNLCVFKDDRLNEIAIKMRAADGFILACPTYYAGIPGTMKCFLDRAFYTSSKYFKYKAATALAVVRRTGGLDVLHQLTNFLNLAETVSPPSQYWTVAYGMRKGEVLKDEEGLQTLRKNAASMAWLLKVIKTSKGIIPLPQEEKRARTNFIR